MSDQKSIWKKELKLRKQPADTPAETPASLPEQRSGSIWKKEIGFRKGSKQNGSKQNGQEPESIGDEATGRKASKKELRMRRAIPAKRPAPETDLDSAPLPVEPEVVLEESPTAADTFATVDPAYVPFEPEGEAVASWRPIEAEPESGFTGALKPEDVETPLPSEHVPGGYESVPWQRTSSDLPVVPGLEDNGVSADHTEVFESHAKFEAGEHDADSFELEESPTPADTFTTADPAYVSFEPEGEAVASWRPTEAEPESGFARALTPEEFEPSLPSEHVDAGYESVPWRQTASDLPFAPGLEDTGVNSDSLAEQTEDGMFYAESAFDADEAGEPEIASNRIEERWLHPIESAEVESSFSDASTIPDDVETTPLSGQVAGGYEFAPWQEIADADDHSDEGAGSVQPASLGFPYTEPEPTAEFATSPEGSFEQELGLGEPAEFPRAARGYDEAAQREESWSYAELDEVNEPQAAPDLTTFDPSEASEEPALELGDEDSSTTAVWSFESGNVAPERALIEAIEHPLDESMLFPAPALGADEAGETHVDPDESQAPADHSLAAATEASVVALAAAAEVAEAASAPDVLESESAEAKPKKQKKSRFGRDVGAPPKADGEARANQIVGVRTGSSQIVAAVVRNTPGAHELTQLVSAPLERGIIVAGEVREPEALARELKSLFSTHKLPRKGIRLGIASSRVGVRTLEVPAIEDAKLLENAIRFRAQEVLPIPLNDAILDHIVLGETTLEEGPGLRILVAFAHRELIDRYVEAFKAARLKVAAIDFEAFALLRAVANPLNGDGVPSDRATVAVAVGQERTIFAVAEGDVCDFTRVLEWGGGSLTVAIARELNLTPSQAEPVKRTLTLAGEIETDLTSDQVDTAREAMRKELQLLAREILASLQFYQSRPGSLAIGEILLTGGGAEVPGLPEELQSRLGVPVRVIDPLEHVRAGKKAKVLHEHGASAIAIGLGMEA